MSHLLEHDLITMRRSMSKIIQDYHDEHVRPGWLVLYCNQRDSVAIICGLPNGRLS